jgi:alkylation response protein AidB-like acyl-CoA dehydrogenase
MRPVCCCSSAWAIQPALRAIAKVAVNAWRGMPTGQDVPREITMAKLFTSETYVKVANLGMQVLAAFGYCEEFDMARHYRDARAATIAAGTSQIQRNLIANLMGLKVQ